MQKDRFGGFDKGHSFKKPRDDRGLELATSGRRMSHKKFITERPKVLEEVTVKNTRRVADTHRTGSRINFGWRPIASLIFPKIEY